jgi:hypothetical protein
MISLKNIVMTGLAATVMLSFPGASAQNTPADIQQKLNAQYTLTKTTADRSDIVTAGSILVLEKDGLLMCAATNGTPASNTYKDGKISAGAMGKIMKFGSFMHSDNAVATRAWVTGEKFWITKIDVTPDAATLYFYSDPISDVRYYSTLKIPFPKGSIPSADQVLTTVAQVIKIQPSDDAGNSGGDAKQQPAAPANQAAAQPPPPAMAPIPPPPPPSDTPTAQPKTIKLGQTKDHVSAIFGTPTKIVKLAGTKELDYYPDMKVTFINNKVTDVQ